jgi:hypothetical protein
MGRSTLAGSGRTPRRLWTAARFAVLALAAATSLRAVAPNFTAIAPAGGERDSEVEITLRGDRLADAAEILFYRPGLTLVKFTETTDKRVKAMLRVAPDCPLGEHPVRLRTASGISALRVFYVGPFPCIEEKEPNNAATKPQPVAMNTTVQGSIGLEDVDFFSVTANKGQRVSVEIEGARLGRTMFDPVVIVTAPDGKTVARSDDTPLLGHDGFVSFLAPAEGAYVIQVRDMTYAGNNHFYRLHVGTFPRPTAIFPLGGQAGETLDAQFIGDPSGDFRQPVTLPTETRARYGVIAEHDGVAPSPNWLRVTEYPNAPALKPAAAQAQAPLLTATAPFAFNGVLETKGDAAFFKFKARKDQNLNFEVFARRLGSPLDSVLTVFDAKGKSLGNNDDAAGNPDSAVRLKIPADGEYTVKVADQLARGGPSFTYRVEVAEVRPAVTLSIPDTARYDNETRKSLAVPRGNRFAVLLNLTRDACNSDLQVAFDGLPTGITLQADTVPGSLSAVPVVFEADADAPLAGKVLAPTARFAGDTKEKDLVTRFRHTVEWVRIQNDTVYTRSEVDQIAAAVVEEVPFKVRIVEPKVPLVQNGEMNLQIEAERVAGFDEPITVKMLWNPPGVSSLPDMVIPKGATSVAYKLNSNNKAEARSWKIAVIAGATVKGGTAYVSSQLAALEIAPAYLSGKMNIAKIERGQTGRMICTLEQKRPFAGTATARLVGLPANVTAADVAITAESKTAEFEVVTTDKSPTGNFKNVFCEVTITRDGQPIPQTIAPGSMLRIDAPKAKPTIAAVTATPAPTP